MIPSEERRDDHGDWLQFRTGDSRILTAFAPPRDSDTNTPISLGWPGIGSPQLFAQTITSACVEQSKWLTEGFDSGYKERFDLHIHAVSFGKTRTENDFSLEKMPKDPAEMIDSHNHPQLARIELVRTEGDASHFELVSWMRFFLSYDEAVAIPYGGTGIVVRPRDLRRSGLQDIIATFILKTNVHGVNAQDIRDVLRDVIAKLGPPIRMAA